MKPPKNERKDFRIWTELSGAALSENTISGAAAVIGNVDCYGDVLFPGAFPKLVLADFLRTGFVPDSHNWGSMAQMVAMPTSIKEQGRQLFGEAEFHGTEYAQNVRQICMERMAKGLAVGLSIAFYLDYSDAEARMWFESGEQMAKYIKDTGLDQSLFDMKGIKGWGDKSCRAVFKVKRLCEWSPVPIPANPSANAASIKQFASEFGSLADLTSEEHSQSVLAAVRSWAERMSSIKGMREADGRSLSDARRADIEELKGLLDSLLVSDDSERKAPLTLQLEALRLQAEALQL